MYPILPKNEIEISSTYVLQDRIEIINALASCQVQLNASYTGRVVQVCNKSSANITIIAQSGSGVTYTGRQALPAGASVWLYLKDSLWGEIRYGSPTEEIFLSELNTDLVDDYPVTYNEDDYCIMRFIPTRTISVKSLGLYIGRGATGTHKIHFGVFDDAGTSRLVYAIANATPDASGWVFSPSSSSLVVTAGTAYQILVRNDYQTKNIAALNWGLANASRSGSGLSSMPSTLAGLSVVGSTYRHLFQLRSF